MPVNPALGHRVVAEITLLSTSEGGLDMEIHDGNRSFLFVFPQIGGRPNQQGAVIERVIGAGRPGSTFSADIQFFDDSARIAATRGAEFDLWLGRTVGHGSVSEVIPSL